jgi:sec-independent protein translocase protein TatC
MALRSPLRRRKVAAPPASAAQGDGAPTAQAAEALSEMSFIDHLEDLRWAIFRGLIGLMAAVVVCAFFSDWIIDVLLMGPTRTDFFMYELLGIDAKELDLLNRSLPGQFFVHIGAVLSAGVVIGSPAIVYSIWRFIEPGLYPHEKKGLRFASFFATAFFALGVAFGYLIIGTLAIQFFANYSISEQIVNEFDVTRYFSMLVWWSFGTGILFELPVVIYFLAKLGIATPDGLRKARKYAFIVVLILGAFFTPPDPLSQLLVAAPLMLLYEVSIKVAGVVQRREKKRLAREAAEDAAREAREAREAAEKKREKGGMGEGTT